MSAPTICTIIAKNYVAHARVLCRSFRSLHPNSRCYVLVIDEFEGAIDSAKEDFTVLSLRDIPLSEPRNSFYFKYNVTELATAVKPFLLDWLLRSRDEEIVLYLDPDIFVTGSLSPLFERLTGSANILLTPHLDTPYPDDGFSPDDRHILISGIFNLGFLGVRRSTETFRLLKWLKEKLSEKCIIAHSEGLFVDQRFFDIAYTMFEDIKIERNVGANVAYWNLHSRFLSRSASGEWLCNGTPLRFFHFSDYHPENPNVISGQMNRYRLSDRPDLNDLFETYRAALVANGYELTRRLPYSFGSFNDGTPIPHEIRAFYRDNYEVTKQAEDPFTSNDLRIRAVNFTKWQRRFRRIGNHQGIASKVLRFVCARLMFRTLRSDNLCAAQHRVHNGREDCDVKRDHVGPTIDTGR